MAKKVSKLRGALDRHQGKDYKVEKQRRLQKNAEKRKRQKAQASHSTESAEEYNFEDDDEEDDAESISGVLKALEKHRAEATGGDKEADWDTDDEEDDLRERKTVSLSHRDALPSANQS